MFGGDSADMCGGKYLLMSIVGQAEGLACTDPGAETPIGMSGIKLEIIKVKMDVLRIHNIDTVASFQF